MINKIREMLDRSQGKALQVNISAAQSLADNFSRIESLKRNLLSYECMSENIIGTIMNSAEIWVQFIEKNAIELNPKDIEGFKAHYLNIIGSAYIDYVQNKGSEIKDGQLTLDATQGGLLYNIIMKAFQNKDIAKDWIKSIKISMKIDFNNIKFPVETTL